MANQLALEKSPYLRQHRNNPVHWCPWGQEALDKAQNENKLLIVSIGYSACHWCHVMERESFENKQIAELMNTHFVSIKVDREERPDIDQIYMLAVQLMTGRGGWPLNCICLPDGRPIYGGTYFNPQEWANILQQLQHMWTQDPNMAYEYAEKLASGIKQTERLPIESLPADFSPAQVHDIVEKWRDKFDPIHGGLQQAPKFPMPNNWDFLLQYGVWAGDTSITDHVHFTLKKIAAGGIYDHVGGGFARYSVDERWHIPHFEKMLYDNAQLVSLYLSAYQHQPNPQYLRIIRETLNWIIREMTDQNGGFYCALDADSEGVEGKFYTFSKEEIETIIGPEYAPLLAAYYNLSAEGNWAEERTNVLYHHLDADELAEEYGYDLPTWDAQLAAFKNSLLQYREGRVRPELDDKQLTAWNAMTLKAFAEAYRILGDPEYLNIALANAEFIITHLITESGGLLHQPADQNRQISGFLDDYAFTIEAFVALYEATFDEQYLVRARELTDYTIRHFMDTDQGVFYYTDEFTQAVVARKAELMDNVIPSSNSTLLRQFQKLGFIFDVPEYHEIVKRVLPKIIPSMALYGSAYSNWAMMLLHEIMGYHELLLSGTSAAAFRKVIDGTYIPNKIVLGGTSSKLPVARERLNGQSQAFLCKNKVCSLPVHSPEELLARIKENV